MKIPVVKGIIRRRLLVNFRIDPEIMTRQLPEPFRPKLHEGYAIAGICLIRLEQIRPRWIPLPVGLSSENAAHRIAVTGRSPQFDEAVYIPRRDSSSWLNHIIGGRLFPGRHHRARFHVNDDGANIDLELSSMDGNVAVKVSGKSADSLPDTSIFSSIDEASQFFERGSLGYSATQKSGQYDGLVLDTQDWFVQPLQVDSVHSSYFEDPDRFPTESIEFDHALVMRNLKHTWHAAPDLYGPEKLNI